MPQQRPNLPLGQRRDIVQASLLQLLDLVALQHPPVTHHGHLLTPKHLSDLLNLQPQRGEVQGIALEDLGGDGLPALLTQQPNDDLRLTGFLVAVVSPGGQFITLPLQIAARDIVEE
jgi:hypothetical protein